MMVLADLEPTFDTVDFDVWPIPASGTFETKAVPPEMQLQREAKWVCNKAVRAARFVWTGILAECIVPALALCHDVHGVA